LDFVQLSLDSLRNNPFQFGILAKVVPALVCVNFDNNGQQGISCGDTQNMWKKQQVYLAKILSLR